MYSIRNIGIFGSGCVDAFWGKGFRGVWHPHLEHCGNKEVEGLRVLIHQKRNATEEVHERSQL
jgi:hypothetical protein